MTTWHVGYWNESESREITRCPSNYAADWETLRTAPGRYPIYMDWKPGFTCPMVGDFSVGIPSARIAGKIYSGFGGVNFASRDLPQEPAKYCFHLYQFQASGNPSIEAVPGMEWLFDGDYSKVVERCRSMTWDDVRSEATNRI